MMMVLLMMMLTMTIMTVLMMVIMVLMMMMMVLMMLMVTLIMTHDGGTIVNALQGNALQLCNGRSQCHKSHAMKKPAHVRRWRSL